MSEQQADQISGGSDAKEPVVTSKVSGPAEAPDAALPAIHVAEAPMISPDHEAPGADEPKSVAKDAAKETAKVDVKTETKAAEVPKHAEPPKPAEPPTIEAIKAEPIPTAAIEAPKVAPVKAEPVKAEMPKLSSLGAAFAPFGGKVDAQSDVKSDAKIEPKLDAPAAAAAEPRAPKILMMPSNDRAAPGGAADVKPAAAAAADKAAKPQVMMPPPVAPAARRGLPMAAMLALAMVAGGVGGALATMALVHRSSGAPATAAAADPNLAASVTRIDGDLANLKASLEQTNQTSLVELNKTAERLDKVEKAQADLAAKTRPSEIQKLSEAVERLRAAQASASSQSQSRETTASVQQTQQAPAQTASAAAAQQQAAAAPAVGRLPVVDGWVIRNVGRGGALIEGRQGLYEVYAGDPVPGLGRVDAIRKQDGRWVVVTTRGLIVAR